MAVVARWRGGMLAEAEDRNSGHRVLGDEPEPLGGQNLGPNPFSLLKMSLANCTIVTVVGEAELIGASLTSLEVEVNHKQNKLVGGPKDPEQRTLRITGFRRSIRVAGDLTEDQVKQLLWAAEHCPVSNTLEGAVPIETTIEHVGNDLR